jgi:hypothetical protein
MRYSSLVTNQFTPQYIEEQSTGANISNSQFKIGKVVLLSLLAATCADISGQNFYLEPRDILTILQPSYSYGASLDKPILNSYQQIMEIKQSMGLNILDLAAVLNVSRPTVYSWLETEGIAIRKQNESRINLLYQISEYWRNKNEGQLGSYLYKEVDDSNLSLFRLLKNKNLDLKKVYSRLDGIAQNKLNKRNKEIAHKALLKQHGFKPISAEEMNERLDEIHFLD